MTLPSDELELKHFWIVKWSLELFSFSSRSLGAHKKGQILKILAHPLKISENDLKFPKFYPLSSSKLQLLLTLPIAELARFLCHPPLLIEAVRSIELPPKFGKLPACNWIVGCFLTKIATAIIIKNMLKIPNIQQFWQLPPVQMPK